MLRTETPKSQKRRIDAYVGIKWSGQKLPRPKVKQNSLRIKKEKRKQEEK